MQPTKTCHKSATVQPFKQEIINEMSPTQYGCGKSTGGLKLIFVVQLLLEAKPNLVVIAVCVENAYNEIDFWSRPSVRPLWYYLWRSKCIRGHVSLGRGERMEMAPFVCAEGEQQGAVESGASFCLGIDNINRPTSNNAGAFGHESCLGMIRPSGAV